MTIVRHAFRHVQHGLIAKVELRRQRELVAFLHANAIAEVVERFGNGQRGRCQDARGNAVKQAFLQQSGNVDRAGFEKYSAATPFDPRHIVFAEPALKHFQVARDFAGPPLERFPFSGEIVAFLQRSAGFLKRADQRANAFKWPSRLRIGWRPSGSLSNPAKNRSDARWIGTMSSHAASDLYESLWPSCTSSNRRKLLT